MVEFITRVTRLSSWLKTCLALRLNLRLTKFQLLFFLLKLSAVCTFWIVLMCWCQKWFLKNEKTSLTCISARKAIWKATTTTLPNTLLVGHTTLGTIAIMELLFIKTEFIMDWNNNFDFISSYFIFFTFDHQSFFSFIPLLCVV